MKRYHDLDALRGFAMLLGIGLHGLLSFTFMPVWPAQDIHQNSQVYGFILNAIHGFRMPLFFLVSGFFTSMMLQKKGATGLIKHRATRILLPLVFGTLIVWPTMAFIGSWGTQVKSSRPTHRSADTESGFISAVKDGKIQLLEDLVRKGVDVNQRDAMGVSALEWAAMYNQPEVIEFLVENGADIHSVNRDGSSPLHHAAFLGRTESVQTLLELGTDPNQVNNYGHTALNSAKLDMESANSLLAYCSCKSIPKKWPRNESEPRSICNRSLNRRRKR